MPFARYVRKSKATSYDTIFYSLLTFPKGFRRLSPGNTGSYQRHRESFENEGTDNQGPLGWWEVQDYNTERERRR